MPRLKWRMRKTADIGAIAYMRRSLSPIEPRNAAADPAFGDFNLPLPEQLSPGTTGVAVTERRITPRISDIENTPTNDCLRKLAADNPPPSRWLEGDDEDLF